MTTVEILDVNEKHGLMLTAVMPGYHSPKYEPIPEGVLPIEQLSGVNPYVAQCHAVCRQVAQGLVVIRDTGAPLDGWRRI